MNYVGALLNNKSNDCRVAATAYVGDEVMLQVAGGFKLGTTMRESWLDAQPARAPLLNIRYSQQRPS